MSLADALTAGRAAAEARMTETVLFVTRTLTTSGLATTPVDTAIGAPVPARVKYENTLGRDVESGEQFAAAGRRQVSVPVGSVQALPDTIIKVLDSTVDASLIGREFRITDRPQAGQTTAWRYPVEEVS